ncbi:flagellar biosynthesis protein FliQ [Caproiciproducens sp. NJN-50]|uniref:flagellar biosynthesis protein FliQ n=1 Tax=Acutalibacteraceae TaxID=3082771 RepID=UPI000FFE103B|nr:MULTISPECIES: flagellar biosynthesis protein FliQ [Acutalibacteraceae]QAT50678.1 flagellar biosynthesis protein FliQ [Caproiciproducens sp. NJN-50]
MTVSKVMEIMHAAMLVILKIASPILIASMLVGLVISILQAATQIHEQTVAFVPKLFTIAAVLVLLGPWIMQVMNDFMQYIFGLIVSLN